MKKEIKDDDGRTIADMSSIERPRSFFDIFPHKPKSEKRPESAQPMEKEDRRAYVRAAILSALVVGLIFAVGLGLIVLILYLIW